MDVVGDLDLTAIERTYQQKDHRGERPWNPRMMVALLLYDYCLGIRSSRRLEKAGIVKLGRVALDGTEVKANTRQHKTMSHAHMVRREAELKAQIAAMLVDARADMHARLHTVPGKSAYKRRKCIVEPVFGQMKEARGIRTFLLRGIDKVRGEWNIVCLTHNLLKLFRFSHRSPLAVR